MPQLNQPTTSAQRLSLGAVASTWWPLAASWLLMGVEMPIVAAVLGRLPEAEVQLAAFGGVVFPMALIIEAPVIMLLAASVRLSNSPENFRFMQRFSRVLGISLTALHGLIAFTPLFDILVVPLIDPPEAVVEPSRIGFQCMLPFTWAVAERRFHQGLLIRFKRQRQVGLGTVVRLLGMGITIVVLASFASRLPFGGATIGALAISVGVVMEAIYARAIALKVERGELLVAGRDEPRLDLSRTIRFYLPLAMTSVLTLAAQPIGSAGMNRMPEALASLAIWPALGGLAFLLRSSGIAFTEVAIRHAGDANSRPALRTFAIAAGTALSLVTILFAVSPLAETWYGAIEGLPEEMITLAKQATWAIIPLPLLSFLASYWQGLLVEMHKTRPVSEGVAIGLATTTIVLIILAWSDVMAGAIGASLALSLGAATQCAWLWYSVRQFTNDAGDESHPV